MRSSERSSQPTVVSGEPERIHRAISNLLGNTHKWSPSGGLVELELVNGALAIRDHGPGFDDVDLPHVFDRFYRADSARGMPGSGLGLAIVRQAAEAHGGTATAANAAGGGGARDGVVRPIGHRQRRGGRARVRDRQRAALRAGARAADLAAVS